MSKETKKQIQHDYEDFITGQNGQFEEITDEMKQFQKDFSKCVNITLNLEQLFKLVSYRCISQKEFVSEVKDQVTMFNKNK